MIKISAPYYPQAIVLIFRVHTPFGILRRMFIRAIDEAFPICVFQVHPHFWSADDRVFSTQKHRGVVFQEVFFPQNVLRPEERPRQGMSHPHVFGAKVPQEPLVGKPRPSHSLVTR